MSTRWVRIGLGVLVLGTWGAVIQRALRRPVEGPTEAAPQQAPAKITSADAVLEELPPLTRDPFLDNDVRKAAPRNGSTASSTTPHPAVAAPKPVEKGWPEIRYNGIVRPRGGTAGVAFLSVGSRTVLLQRGQEAEGVHVVDLTMDSVVVVWNTERRTFRRK